MCVWRYERRASGSRKLMNAVNGSAKREQTHWHSPVAAVARERFTTCTLLTHGRSRRVRQRDMPVREEKRVRGGVSPIDKQDRTRADAVPVLRTIASSTRATHDGHLSCLLFPASFSLHPHRHPLPWTF